MYVMCSLWHYCCSPMSTIKLGTNTNNSQIAKCGRSSVLSAVYCMSKTSNCHNPTCLKLSPGLWQSASDTAHDLVARLAIVHMVHEARQVLFSPLCLVFVWSNWVNLSGISKASPFCSLSLVFALSLVFVPLLALCLLKKKTWVNLYRY